MEKINSETDAIDNWGQTEMQTFVKISFFENTNRFI